MAVLQHKYHTMNITFTETKRSLVHTLALETDATADIFRQELDDQNWEVEVFKNVNGRTPGRQSGGRCTINGIGRYATHSSLELIQGTVLKELFSYAISDSFKLQWLSEFIKYPEFCKLWGSNNVEFIASYTVLNANYVLDNPKTTIALHLDNRMLLATGMIYLNETNDDLTQSLQSTTFYTDQNKSEPMVIKPNFGKGWVAANTHNSWHEGINTSNQKRYSLLLGLGIDITKIRNTK